MQWLAKISVKRPVFATVLILLICVIGATGYSQLGVDRFPKVDFPTVVVVTRLAGAAPEEVETELTDKIEEAVNTIGGIDELRSSSTEGVSQVFVTFDLNKDVDVAAQEIRDHVDRVVPDLPKDIDTPVVSKMDPDASPVLYVSVNAEKPIREVTEVADKQIRRQIENVPGVGQVLLLGGTRRQINIWLDPVKLRAANVDATAVERAIRLENMTTPGGQLDTGPEQLTLRIRGRTRSRRGRQRASRHGRHPRRRAGRSPRDPQAIGIEHRRRGRPGSSEDGGRHGSAPRRLHLERRP